MLKYIIHRNWYCIYDICRTSTYEHALPVKREFFGTMKIFSPVWLCIESVIGKYSKLVHRFMKETCEQKKTIARAPQKHLVFKTTFDPKRRKR